MSGKGLLPVNEDSSLDDYICDTDGANNRFNSSSMGHQMWENNLPQSATMESASSKSSVTGKVKKDNNAPGINQGCDTNTGGDGGDITNEAQSYASKQQRSMSTSSTSPSVDALSSWETRKCAMDGCDSKCPEGNAKYCDRHSGESSSRKCEMIGCDKCAQGNTKYCIRHGGE